MDVKKKLGERIRYLRKMRGMTQEELAERADVSVTFIGLTERGKNIPSVLTCFRIARALGVSLSELFRFDEGGEKRVLDEIYIKIKSLDDEDVMVVKEITDVLLKRKRREEGMT